MKLTPHVVRNGLWLLLALVAAGLGLLLTRIAARGRAAAAAMSAELLSPLEAGATDSLAAVALGDGGVPGPPSAPASPADTAAAPATESAAPAGLAAIAPEVPIVPDLDPELFPDWTSYAVALPLARRMERPVLLAFGAYGCEQCDELAREVFRDEAAGVTLRSAVVPVAVDAPLLEDGDSARAADELKRRFGVTSFPTLVLYFPASGRVKKLEGYPGRDRTLRWVTETSATKR
jgi:thiol-disulfide isomerase/thioredoxin